LIIILNNYTITIDPVYKMNTYSVQIDDHILKQTKILDNAYSTIMGAIGASQKYLNQIGLRRQLGDKRSSK